MKAREVRERLNKQGLTKDDEVRIILETLAERLHLTRQQLLECATSVSSLADSMDKITKGTGKIAEDMEKIKKRLPSDDDNDGPTGVNFGSEKLN